MAAGMIYVGTVTEIDPAGPLVNIPMMAPRASFGPLQSLVPDLEVGERVAVSNLGATANAYIILGRMSGRAPTIDEIPDLPEQIDALNTRVEALRIDQDADESMFDDQGNRITAVETVNAGQNTRLTGVEGRATAVEGRAGALESRATAIEGVNTGQGTAIAANGTAITQLRADTAGKATAKGQLLIATAAGVLAGHAAPSDGLLLVPDSTAPDGWSAKDVLGMPKGLTGAVSPTRYVGATVSGPPVTGAFLAGDFVLDAAANVWVCTVAGTSGTWVSPTGVPAPFAHAGATSGFQTLSAANGAYLVVSTAQELIGGITLVSNALVAPRAGRYLINAKSYFSGGSAYPGGAEFVLNSATLPPPTANLMGDRVTVWKADSADYQGSLMIVRRLAANDAVRLWQIGPNSTYGGNGYNGAWFEMYYLGP